MQGQVLAAGNVRFPAVDEVQRARPSAHRCCVKDVKLVFVAALFHGAVSRAVQHGVLVNAGLHGALLLMLCVHIGNESERMLSSCRSQLTLAVFPSATSSLACLTLAFTPSCLAHVLLQELINGRLAMIGFVAALGAELATHKNIFRQFAEAPGVIVAFSVLIAIASIIPMVGSLQQFVNAMVSASCVAAMYLSGSLHPVAPANFAGCDLCCACV